METNKEMLTEIDKQISKNRTARYRQDIEKCCQGEWGEVNEIIANYAGMGGFIKYAKDQSNKG